MKKGGWIDNVVEAARDYCEAHEEDYALMSSSDSMDVDAEFMLLYQAVFNGAKTEPKPESMSRHMTKMAQGFPVEPYKPKLTDEEIAREAGNRLEAAFHCGPRDVQRFMAIVLDAIKKSKE